MREAILKPTSTDVMSPLQRTDSICVKPLDGLHGIENLLGNRAWLLLLSSPPDVAFQMAAKSYYDGVVQKNLD